MKLLFLILSLISTNVFADYSITKEGTYISYGNFTVKGKEQFIINFISPEHIQGISKDVIIVLLQQAIDDQFTVDSIMYNCKTFKVNYSRSQLERDFSPVSYKTMEYDVMEYSCKVAKEKGIIKDTL